MGVLGVCLGLLWQAQVFIPTDRFTLAWTHSIEKVRWEEDYLVAGTPHATWLQATAARIKGSGAGMEPPPDARLIDGWYVYTPTQQRVDALRLSRSEFTQDYELCLGPECRPLGHWVGAEPGTVVVQACHRPVHHAPQPRVRPAPAPESSG